jgi:excisionase family DNA binding protein
MPRSGKKGLNPGGTLSTQEVATVLGVSHPTLLKLLKENKIPEPQKVGRTRHWNSSDVKHAQIVVETLHASGELRVRGRSTA